MSNLPDDLLTWMLTTWCDASIRSKLACSTQRFKRLAACAIERVTASSRKCYTEYVALPLATGLPGGGVVDDTAKHRDADLRTVSRGLVSQSRQSFGIDFNLRPGLDSVKTAVVNSVRHQCSLVIRAEQHEFANRWTLCVIKRAKGSDDIVKQKISCEEAHIEGFYYLRTCSSHPDYIFIDVSAHRAFGMVHSYYRCALSGPSGLTLTSLSAFYFEPQSELRIVDVDSVLRLGYLGYLLGLYCYNVTIPESKNVAAVAEKDKEYTQSVSESARCSITMRFGQPSPGDYEPIQTSTSVLLVPKCFFVGAPDIIETCEVVHGNNITLLAVTLLHRRGCLCGIKSSRCTYFMPIDPLNGHPLTHLVWCTGVYLSVDVMYAHWGDDQYERGSSWYVGVWDRTASLFKLYRNDGSLVYGAAAHMIVSPI